MVEEGGGGGVFHGGFGIGGGGFGGVDGAGGGCGHGSGLGWMVVDGGDRIARSGVVCLRPVASVLAAAAAAAGDSNVSFCTPEYLPSSGSAKSAKLAEPKNHRIKLGK